MGTRSVQHNCRRDLTLGLSWLTIMDLRRAERADLQVLRAK
jgi:hypothetical protein